MLRLIIFLLGSVGFVLLSFHSLSKPRSHGFPRFFAFEAILGLVALNAPVWFVRPFSLPQLVSWALLLISGFLAIHAFFVLHKFGLPDASIQDVDRLAAEKTTRLVSVGAYRFIRHPLYVSLLCLTLGVFLKHVSFFASLLVFLACLALYLTALFEEHENLQLFGDAYTEYMRHTRRFIPFLF